MKRFIFLCISLCIPSVLLTMLLTISSFAQPAVYKSEKVSNYTPLTAASVISDTKVAGNQACATASGQRLLDQKIPLGATFPLDILKVWVNNDKSCLFLLKVNSSGPSINSAVVESYYQDFVPVEDRHQMCGPVPSSNFSCLKPVTDTKIHLMGLWIEALNPGVVNLTVSESGGGIVWTATLTVTTMSRKLFLPIIAE